MNLLIAGDHAFLPGIEVTLASMACTNPEPARLNVALLDLGFEAAAARSLEKALCSRDPRFKLRILQPDPQIWHGFQPATPPGFPHSQDRLLKPYQWLAALEQLQDWSEVLVLDGDLLVTTSLNPAFQSARGGLPAAACQDASHQLAHDCPDPNLIARHGGDPYFNSGLVWINLEYWRTNHCFEQALGFIGKFGPQIRQEDQTVFNATFAGRIAAVPRQYNLTHEALGHLETPAGQRLPWEGYVWHLWRQYKPWLAFNPLESGALWYGLHEVWHGQQNPRYHTTRPGYRVAVTKMRQPRLAQFYHRLRGHSEMANYWNARAKSGTGRGDWAKRFATRVDEAAEWWRHKLA